MCTLCEKTLSDKYGLERHLLRVHEGGYKYHCEQCGKGTMDMTALNVHLRSHTGTTEHKRRLYICKFCRKRFARKYDLRRHELAIHNKSFRYQCEQCGKGFMDSHALQLHIDKHHREGQKAGDSDSKCPLVTCPVCSKQYARKYELEAHMQRLHPECLKNCCTRCGKQYMDIHRCNK